MLWQPGTDHAGIATADGGRAAIDGAAKEPSRREMGREKFLERVWAWKAESGGTIVNQLKRLGASCDWSRERFTMDEGLSKAVLKVFVQLFNEKLIYKDKRLVNWDPKLLTAISGSGGAAGRGARSTSAQPRRSRSNRHQRVHHRRHHAARDRMPGDVAIAMHPDGEKLKSR